MLKNKIKIRDNPVSKLPRLIFWSQETSIKQLAKKKHVSETDSIPCVSVFKHSVQIYCKTAKLVQANTVFVFCDFSAPTF